MNPSPEPKATDKPKWKVQQKIVKWRFLEWSTRPEKKFYGQLAFEQPFKGKVAVLDYDENAFAKSITDARDGGATAIIIINKKTFDGVKEERPDAVAEMPPDMLPTYCFRRGRRAADEEPPPDKEPDKHQQSRCTRLGQLTQVVGQLTPVVDDVFVLMVSYNEGKVMNEHGAGTWLMLEGESSRRETQMHC